MCGPLNREGLLCGKWKDGYGIALLWNAVSAGDMVMDGPVLFPGTLPNNCDVLACGDLTSSPLISLVFMSQIIVYTIRLNVPWHIYIVNNVRGFPYVALQVL